MYNCLNSTFPQVVTDILSSLSFDGVHVTNKNERAILRKELNVRLNDELRKIFDTEIVNEEKILRTIDLKSIRHKMLSDLSWLKGDFLYQSCRAEALSHMPASVYFHTPREFFSNFIEGDICFKFTSTPEVKSYLNTNREKFQEEVHHILKDVILDNVAALETDCHKQFPKGNFLEEIGRSSARKKCIKNGWDSLEESAVNLVSKNDLSVNLDLSYEDLMARAKKMRPLYRKEAQEKFEGH
jgi:hypothetical protein